MKTMYRLCTIILLVCGVFMVDQSTVFADAYWVFFQPRPGWRPGSPVPDYMVRSMFDTGARIRTVSRYFHAVTVDFGGNPSLLQKVDGVIEVRPVVRLAETPDSKALKPVRAETSLNTTSSHMLSYGISRDQLGILKIPELHDLGLTGRGVVIGVLDAGFDTRNTGCLKSLQVADTRNFITGGKDVTGYFHGTAVLGCLAGKYDTIYYGAAFGATYLLALTEDYTKDTHADEDRWVAGVEWCDSLGAKIINSSLGYTAFNSPEIGYSRADMDGKTSLCARAAEIAFSHGILVVNSAGNEGGNSWKIIATPADAEHVIAAGGVGYSASGSPQLWPSSSRGPTADGRIKPDLVACAFYVYTPVPGEIDIFSQLSGTSFSAPFISGLCALLLEAHPDWTPSDITKALKETAHDLGIPGPDNDYGWGLPDGVAALNYSPVTNVTEKPAAYLPEINGNYPNPFNPSTTIGFTLPATGATSLSVFSITGRKVRELVNETLSAGPHSVAWDGRDDSGKPVSSGVYLSRLRMGGHITGGRMLLVK
jgi:serine protease AprX